MGRIMGVDFGTKRVGIAVTDPLKIIASALTTVDTASAVAFIADYAKSEPLECIVIGLPLQSDGSASQSETFIKPFIARLEQALPGVPLKRFDERYTSKMAARTLIDAGYKKKKRQDKKLLDSVSATLILQGYLLSVQ